jgi:hypothetical protein
LVRYVEIDGQLRKIMVVVKVRGANHSTDIREYIINDQGVVVVGSRIPDNGVSGPDHGNPNENWDGPRPEGRGRPKKKAAEPASSDRRWGKALIQERATSFPGL